MATASSTYIAPYNLARQAIRRYKRGHRLALGSPEEVADQLIDWWESGVVDGYTVKVPALPDDLDLFADQVIPILQKRGVFRADYDESTLRERHGPPALFSRH
ncbi:alkanesulfonate monooxygenase SsuD/methylene tetrahydromethanopterin reductase-like flavin-dependent oxidoreductase (luciferase family) [Robbsia andropogonis]|uniref:hypothetical protein n=1 Tax=Robbsia andropogonis TaxID=28092 RepID=UPI003D1EF4C1